MVYQYPRRLYGGWCLIRLIEKRWLMTKEYIIVVVLKRNSCSLDASSVSSSRGCYRVSTWQWCRKSKLISDINRITFLKSSTCDYPKAFNSFVIYLFIISIEKGKLNVVIKNKFHIDVFSYKGINLKRNKCSI